MVDSIAVVHSEGSYWSRLIIDELEAASIEVISIEIDSFREISGQRSSLSRLVRLASSAASAMLDLARRRPHRLLCLYGGTNAVASSVLALFCQRRKPVVFLGGSDFYRIHGPSRSIAFAAYRRASLLLCAGDQLADDVREEGTLGSPVSWHHGTRLPPEPQETIKSPGDVLRVVVSRSLESVYDPSTVMRACALLSTDQQIGLTFLASGKQAHTYEQEAQDYAGNDALRISFGGGYRPDELTELLRSAHVFVSAPHSDGRPTSVIECVLNGLPLVLSDIPANRSLVDLLGATDVAFFEPGSAPGLADAIRSTVDDFDDRAASAFDRARSERSRFDSKVAIAKLLDLMA